MQRMEKRFKNAIIIIIEMVRNFSEIKTEIILGGVTVFCEILSVLQ